MHGRAPTSLIRHLVSTARSLRARYTSELSAVSSSLNEAHRSLADSLQRELSPAEAADILAQSASCASPLLADSPAPDWLLNQLAAWERFAIAEATCLAPALPLPHSPTLAPPAHLYEPFLHLYSRQDRKRRGVFFTPDPVARYIVSEIDHLLRTDFALPNGLATHSPTNLQSEICNLRPEILLLDPACGTGIFLLTTLDHIHRYLTADCITDGIDEPDRRRRWNAVVADLLPRLIGIEILPPAAFLTKLNLTFHLASTGYDFKPSDHLQIHCTDALSPNLQSEICNLKIEIPILLGNPPFSSLSTTTNPWIARLVRGDDEIRGYVRANGQKLGERKTWLHDDYVKFIRLAQWHVEQAGCGIVGFVTNHGYLDNATFRLMRQELLRVFPHIHIIDLHGNRRAGGPRGAGLRPALKPSGPGDDLATDENLFHLDQGLAISLLSRSPQARSASEGSCALGNPPALISPQAQAASPNHVPLGSNPKSQIRHTDLYGNREFKLAALAGPSLALRACEVTPQAPHYRFTPAPATPIHPEYAAAWSLADAMPVNTPAPVTARDHFVVAFTREELEHRIAEFRDLAIPDDEIRNRYFTRTRSARYVPGDTRSWKLAAARQTIAADSDWQAKIVRCLYRPFDWRFVFWHPAMIDWPRTAVTANLIRNLPENSECRMQNAERENCESAHSAFCIHHSALALIARRQQLPTQPCTFFWISDGLALDGVIRSDNRGSESLFPLYNVVGTRAPAQRVGVPSLGADVDTPENSAAERTPNFAPAFLDQLTAATGLRPSPLETLANIYALFHSPTYRARYADSLRTDFPRILLPTSSALFTSLSHFGQQLIALHLLLPTPHSPPLSHSPTLPLSHSLNAFRAGGHLALKKWLQPSRRSTADPDYERIAAAIDQTLAIMPAIDAAVDRSGGWPAAFARS